MENHFCTQITLFTSLTEDLKVLTHHFHFTYFRFNQYSCKGDIGADLGFFIYMFNQLVFFKKKTREEKRKGDVVHIFKNNTKFVKYELQLSMEITFYSGIETTLIIYQIEARIKLHNMIRSSNGKSFLYPNSIVYIT